MFSFVDDAMFDEKSSVIKSFYIILILLQQSYSIKTIIGIVI